MAAVLESHVESAKGGPCRNVATHDASAHNVHVTNVGTRFAAHGLESVLKKEYADQISGCLGQEQPCNRTCLGLECLAALRAITRPEVDHCVRGRVVVFRSLSGYLGRKCVPHERAHERPAERSFPQWRAMRSRRLKGELLRG